MGETKITPKQFVKDNYGYALQIEKETGIPALAIMAQAALESAWGNKAIGNNIFGIKYKKGDLLYREVLTTEYSSNENTYKDYESKTWIPGLKLWKFKVWQKFADYNTPLDAFRAHSRLLLSQRYIGALKWKYSPLRYLIAVWRAGYATDPNYGKKMSAMIYSVKKRLN